MVAGLYFGEVTMDQKQLDRANSIVKEIAEIKLQIGCLDSASKRINDVTKDERPIYFGDHWDKASLKPEHFKQFSPQVLAILEEELNQLEAEFKAL